MAKTAAEATFKRDPIILPSLLKDEYKPGAEMESRAPLNAAFNTVPQAMPKPTQSAESFSMEVPAVKQEASVEAAVKLEPAESIVPEDSGIQIIKNYELGEFEKPIKDAWQTMTANAKTTSSNPDDVALLLQENSVQLYVICALAQQIAAIEENQLRPEQKEILQSIRAVLLAALVDPQNENNWSCFEGIRRDDIDRAIAALQV